MSFPCLGADFEKGLFAYDTGDFATALREWTPLAEQGNPDAQFKLGVMYRKGDGVPQDDKTAVKWYTLAAEQGYAPAQSNLGVMYDKGDGILQDDKIAMEWYTLAAEQGHTNAQFNLAISYANGEVVRKDNVYAYMWANIASFNGNERGGELLGMVAEEMTTSQIEEAQTLARECVTKNYKGC